MKFTLGKHRLWIALLVAMIASATANAQAKLGLTAGIRFDRLERTNYNGTSVWGDDHNITGYYFGVKTDLNTPGGFGLDIGLNFCNRNINNDSKWGMELPINLKFNINAVPMFRPYLLAGVSAYTNFEDIHFHEDLWGDSESWTERVEYALNLGVGVTLAGHLQVGLTYQIPIGTYYYYYSEADKSPYGKLAKNWVLSVAYLF